MLIGGFVIEGSDSKQVLVRALSPSLTAQGVTGALSDPFVYLVNQADPTVIVGSNDNWESAEGISAIENDNLFRPGDSKDAAMILTLQPGAYTAIVQGINSATGVALIEVNEFDQSANNSKLINISTRGYVGTGADVLIGGFVIEGSDSKQVLVRALGPSLTAQGVTQVLFLIHLFIWLTKLLQQLLLGVMTIGKVQEGISAIENNNLFRPGDSKDAAMILTLQPGAYTAIVQGINSATGVALVEVNEL